MIGTVVSYGGDLSIPKNLELIKTLGYLLCDGSSYEASVFPDLFKVIQHAHGGSGNKFNVPDLRGSFIRGYNGQSVSGDPDAASRGPAAIGGATGNNIGSAQPYATALPCSEFIVGTNGDHTHTIPSLSSNDTEIWNTGPYDPARSTTGVLTDSQGAHAHSFSGFDPATIPVNTSLYYIICAQNISQPSASLPVGSMLGWAGSLPYTSDANYLRCNGAPYSDKSQSALLNTIFDNFGGDGLTVFNVPDTRGYFLRGASHGVAVDPDRLSRFAIFEGGSTGDSVGSAQSFSTKAPTGLVLNCNGGHSHNVTGVPTDYHNAAEGASGRAAKYCWSWNTDLTTSASAGNHSHSIVGGDKETRPSNIYLDWLISANTIDNPPPIGSIVAIGFAATDYSMLSSLSDLGWLPCQGSALRLSDSNYTALYGVIGTTFGSKAGRFLLPDLRGYFIQGASSKVPIGTVLNSSTTANGNTPLSTSISSDHWHAGFWVPETDDNQNIVMGYEIAQTTSSNTLTSTDGAHTHSISGGDSESRPKNIYVDYIIRFA